MSLTNNSYEGVHCYDEWTPLKEVLLASVLGANHTVDATFRCFYGKTTVGADVHHFSLSDDLIYRRQAEFQGLKTVLESRGVIVREQQRYEFLTPFSTPYWKAYSRPSDNPRDQILVLGDTLVETPPVVRDRYFENDVWKPVFYSAFQEGARWIAAPRPMMLTPSYDPQWHSDLEPYSHGECSPIKGPGVEMMFDAAQVLKVGLDVVMNVRNANDRLGFQWLCREFPQYRWHSIYLGKDADHIDGELTILRPGLLLVGHNVYERPECLPAFMQSWDRVVMADTAEHLQGLQLASEGIYVNALAIDENTVCMNAAAVKTIKALEARGFTVIPVEFHDSTAFGGGLHCATLDIHRSGNLEDYSG